MATEVEAKFLAAGGSVLEALAVAPTLGPGWLGSPTTVDEIDIYLDTADSRLAAAGWACRLRNRGSGFIASLKGPPPAGGGDDAWLHRRPEVEGPASSSMDPVAWPASDARDTLERLRDGQPLTERLRLRQLRTERDVDVDGDRVGTLSLDGVTVVGPSGQTAGELDVVELELLLVSTDDPVARRRFDILAEALAATPGLVADPRTKLEHALDILARS